MSAATKSSRRRMGITTLISSIFIVASLVWATYNFAIVQSGAVRQYDPHFKYDDIPLWPYDINWAGGRTNWFNNVNYTDVLIDQPLPDDILDHLDDVIFTVVPADPPQLWRVGAYDEYDGSNWGKTNIGTWPVDPGPQLITDVEATNEIYTVIFNTTAGATVGAVELPTLFPEIRVIEDSFVTWSYDVDGVPYPDPGRLLDYDLETDAYGTLLFSPFIQGTTGEEVTVTFDLTYETQDIANVIANAQSGTSAPGWADIYLDLPTLTQRVIDNASQFLSVGTNAYEKAMAVQLYFQSTFDLTINQLDRPGGQEVTDWFLERGGGLPMDFATAYCAFMRYLGVPARLAMGYAIGEPDPTSSYRTLMVRHMAFWAEVFIPMSGATEGEWIQVIPAMLPDDMGGDEDPTNTPIPNVQLIVEPTNGQPWEQIGTPFGLSAWITIDDVLVTTPEVITFYDETDTEFIGVQTIGQPPDNPIANVTYSFPSNATVDYHIIAATWHATTFTFTNRTSVFAVGTPDPYSYPVPPTVSDGFILSETTQLNVSQGLDTHVAYWEDTIHVYGTMTVGGVPVNSSNYDNRNIGIYWDNSFMGNASIDEVGYYELNIYADPMDLSRMTVGDHEVWSWYLGDWDPYGIHRLNEARSSDNSTVTVWGRVGFDLNVFPDNVVAGATIDYDGAAYFLNGTALPSGQQVGVFFHSQANATRGLNATGGFTWNYIIPVTQPDGTYFAYANWSSPWPLIAGNWSYNVPVTVGSSGTNLWINQVFDPLYVSENVTLFGYLTHVSNGTGIGGRWVDIYWNNGSAFLLDSVLTAPDGYFELNYTTLVSDEGLVEYWAYFSSMEPTLADSESLPHRFTTVKKFDVSLDPIFVTPDPVFILQPVDIQGNLSLSEFSFPMAGEWVDFWYENSTGIFYIGGTLTNATGGYFHQYTIPIGQTADEIVYIWASYTSPHFNVYSNESYHEPLLVQATGTLISIQEDFTFYYVNETIFLYGNLQFANGTPIPFQIVDIYWTNSSGTFPYQKPTDAFGNYQMFYNCTPTQDEPETITVDVYWTSWTPTIDDASSSIAPPIQLQRYDLEITLAVPTQLYIDQLDFDIQGVLSHVGGTPVLANEMVLLAFWNGTHWNYIDNPLTNSTGGFLTPLTFPDYTERDYDFYVTYFSSDPLFNDVAPMPFTISRIRYQVNLDVTINPNPVKQNGTLTIHVHAYFAHNGTDISGATVSLFWNNGTLPLPWLGDVITDGTGQVDLFYSGMDWDSVRTGIEVYGIFGGSVFLASNESIHNILTLNQWQTTFTGVNLPVGPYRIGDAIVVTGNLEYVLPSGPYAGVTVELTLLGITRTTDVTASDGSFTLNWDIPGTLSPGSYSFIVEFNSPYPWIAGTSTIIVPPTDVIAPEPQFTEFDVTPTTAYLDQSLTITGRVLWDNGTPYANLPLDIYWGDYFGANAVIVNNYLTDGTGRFTIIFEIPDDLGLLAYVQHVWAYIDPAGYATFGESWWIPITIDIYQATLTTAVDLAVVYLGDNIRFSGTLQFTNGTPLLGYDVEIWWGGNHLLTIPTDLALGTFSYIHNVPYSNAIGVLSGYALFRPPSLAWGDLDTLEFFNDVTVIERVDVFMDPEPADNTVSRCETLVISGVLLNDAGQPANGVTVEATRDGFGTGFSDVSAADGSYSISLLIPDNAPRGSYTISVIITSTYHELRNGPTVWTIQIFIGSDLYVQTNPESRLPGEGFSVDVTLNDDDNNPLFGEWVAIYLGSTHIADVQLNNPMPERFNFVVPLSWNADDGLFNITAEFLGAPFINPDTSISENSVHVFTDVVFSSTPSRVDPGQPFIIECTLRDTAGNLIMFRRADLNYNGTDNYPYYVGADGRLTHNVPAQVDGTLISFTITLVSFDVGNIQSNTFTINIETTGGNPLQGTDLLIASILLVGAVIAVLAYLYIVRGMFRSTAGISRGIDIPTKLRNIKKLADAGK
ncbi:MAG: transglutaminase domain-containing protein, partial [Candidatus Thorarchaeota archaeon]